MSTVKTEPKPSSTAAPAAAEVFDKQPEVGGGHSVITLLCTFDNEEARKKYLALTREIAFPVKAAHPSCLRITQTIPKNTGGTQVLWVEEWTNSDDFTRTMQKLFKDYPKLGQVNEYLNCNPTVTMSRVVTGNDIG